jgi:ribosomal protein S18 acetylase RimI-like enzyme
METLIERITELDGETLVHLLKRAGEQKPEPNADFFKDDKNILLVSRTDGHLSGFLWAYLLERPGSTYPKMLLYSIDVFSEFRRKGMASMLIQELKRIARIRMCREMFVPTNKSNVAAVALYRSTQGKPGSDDDDITFIYDRDALSI